MTLIYFLAACLPLISPLGTEQAIFLFDHGETQMVASMLRYAEQEDKERLKDLDFRLVFMGPSIDAMTKEPFCHYPDKLIHYKDLHIESLVDSTWKRDASLSSQDLNKLTSIQVKKKIWVGVSIFASTQILQKYNQYPSVKKVALRDNPNPSGETDYFSVARQVQAVADLILVPSKAVANDLHTLNKEIQIVGHAPLEEWQRAAKQLKKEDILRRLSLEPNHPILVYTGSYGEQYEQDFRLFLEMLNTPYFLAEEAYVLIVPHPRFKGRIEKEMIKEEKFRHLKVKVASSFEAEAANYLPTIEALIIADRIALSDATSTIIAQASALDQKILYISRRENSPSAPFIYDIKTTEELAEEMRLARDQRTQAKLNVFDVLGIPKEGGRLLWEQFLKP